VPPNQGFTIDGSAADWSAVTPLMTGTTGVRSVSAVSDGAKLYLLVQGTGLNVLEQFFLDTDANPATGFAAAGWTGSSGAEYMLENANLYRHGGSGWSWTPLGQVAFARNDTVVEAAIPISSLGLSPGRRLRIGFLKNNSATERLPAATGTFPTITLPGS
jgi:hypothetical protein